jgi:thioredoxin-like negative regulator of GroEL
MATPSQLALWYEVAMTTRREKLEAMLADEPGDTFLRYSLALELAKEGRLHESLLGLQELTREKPPYVPAYFMAAQQLVQQHELEAARAMLREGITAAREQNNPHAAGEMSEFLASLGPR